MTESDNDKSAVTRNETAPAPAAEPGIAALEQQLSDLATSPHFVPLMGSFRDLLEAERRKNRNRTIVMGAALVVVLGLFIWGPLHLIRAYIDQSERRLAAERATLERVEQALNASMTTLAEASRELRVQLEASHPSPTAPTPAAPAASAVVVAPAPAPAPAVEVPPAAKPPAVLPASVATHTTAVERSVVVEPAKQPPPAVVTSAAPAAVIAPAAPLPAALTRAVGTSAAAPAAPVVTNRLAPTGTVAHLDDVLDEVDRAIMAIKQKRQASTNATEKAKP